MTEQARVLKAFNIISKNNDCYIQELNASVSFWSNGDELNISEHEGKNLASIGVHRLGSNRYAMDKKRVKPGYIYFYLGLHSGFIKIGCSNNPIKRCNDLMKVEKGVLIRFIECQDMFYSEKLAHKFFKDFRVIGEWFSISSDVAIQYKEKCYE